MLPAMRPRRLALALALLAALAVAGCGGSGTSSNPAGFAPSDSQLFIEATLRPSGETKANVDEIASSLFGIDNLGELIVSETEDEAADSGSGFDFEKDVEPWLGDVAGIFFRRFEGDEPEEGGAAIETTDPDAAGEFLDEQIASKDTVEDRSYEGVDYKFDSSDESALGVVGDFIVFGEDEKAFRAAVDASSGDSLDDEDRYNSAVEGATDGSLADVYLDVGALIDESGGQIDPQARKLLQGAGIDPSEATAVASVVPGSDRVEIDLSSELAGEEAPSGDASELLGSLPGDSFAAFAVSGFGEQLQEAIDSLDKSGIPGEIPPNQLKSGLKQAGIDLERIASSLGDAGVFASGRSEGSLGGALVLTTDDPEQASNTVSNIGLLLRSARTPGVTAISGKAQGFSIRSEDLGRKPLVVVSAGNRVAIGYGAKQAIQGVSDSPRKLADSPAYEEAVAALGETPISAFVDGPAALALANALVPRSESGFREARPYLRKVASVALGSSSEGERATAKLIVSLEK
jgi:hypothetical protein